MSSVPERRSHNSQPRVSGVFDDLYGPCEHWIRSAAPHRIAVTAGPVEAATPFSDGEAIAMANAVVRRRNEFFTGRRLARQALAEFGCQAGDIPIGAMRMPVWPEPFVGSISHSNDLCVAVAARAQNFVGLGIDVEIVGAVTEELHRQVATKDEMARIAQGALDGIDPGTLCFSAKEAVYKAYCPSTHCLLDFQDLHIQIDWQRHLFTTTLVTQAKPSIGSTRNFQGRFARIGRYVVTLAWIPRTSV